MTRPRERMSPKTRLLAALLGGRVDRPAVGNPTSVATVELQQRTGFFFPEAHRQAGQMASLAAAGHDLLGFDTIAPVFSVDQEAEALGCAVDWGTPQDLPQDRTHPFQEPEEVVIPPDFLERPSIAVVLESLRLLRREYGDHVAIVGKVMGPWTLAYHVAGVQNFLTWILLDPDKVRRFLRVLKEITLLFAMAQLRAGADVLTLADHATGDLVSGKTYRDFLLPVHEELTASIPCPLILHICGNTTDRLEHIVAAGFSCFHFDSKVDAFRAREVVGRRMSLVGNLNNPETLLHGTPDDVRRETLRALEAGVDIIGPECAVPLPTPNANLAAIAEAVREYGACH